MNMPVDPGKAGLWTKAQREALDMSGVELARRISQVANETGDPTIVSQQSLSKFEKGTTKRAPAWMRHISAALAGGREQAKTKPRQDDGSYEDAVRIQEWNYSYGMGGGTYLDLPVTGEKHQFSRTWLRQFTNAPPDKIFIASGTGDSMTPTILDADIVIVDTSERSIRAGDKIWAIAYGEVGLIKRVRPMPDGSFKMLSDNPVVDAETAYDGEMSVVGRVVAVIRKT